MKIEICEQMVQSWLINCRNCQVAQTNWSISPLKDIDRYKKDISDYIDFFVNALRHGVSSGAIDSDVLNTTDEDISELHKSLNEDGEEVSFMRVCQMLVAEREAAKDKNGNIDFSKISILGRAGKARELQFVRQTEIDILGVELDNGQAKNIYLVDTAFHKDGLNYSDTVSSVTKKIIRAILVADIIFGTDIPVHIIFASPVCKPGPEGKIIAVKKYIDPLIEKRPTLHGKTSQVSIEIYLNQNFAQEIYLPLRKEIDALYGGNDLFMRSLNLAKAAEEKLPESEKAMALAGGNPKIPAPAATPSGGASGSSGTATTPHGATGTRDCSKYIFNSKLCGKGPLLVALIEKYLEDNPGADAKELKDKFSLKLGSHPAIMLSSEVPGGWAGRVQECRLLDGTIVYINKQVKLRNMDAILRIANELGYIVDKA